jgi:16S rRNA (cytosine1407-C5)-methyltransferase
MKGGVVLYTAKKKDYLPSHELALSQLLKIDAFPAIELDYRQAVSYLKRDNLILNNAPEGWIVLSYKGVKMGFIKNIGSRINNYFPMDWRIRMKIPATLQNYLIEWKD